MDALSAATRSAATPAPAAPASEVKAPAKISSDFETFLKMLTVQMQNQDPLNPVQSEDFAVQLATFSGVEQQVRTNDILKAMSAQQAVTGLSQLAGWVGMEARADVPVRFDGAPVTLYPDLPTGTDQATLVVTDRFGAEVSRSSVPISTEPLDWAGTDQKGAPLPKGVYDLRIEARGGGRMLDATIPDHYARITEARLENGSPVVVFDGGATKSASAVTAVRAPGG